jgi:hypothetical protein
MSRFKIFYIGWLLFLISSCAEEDKKVLYDLGVIPQDSSVIIPVKKQQIAYNARDIEKFAPNFSDSVKLYRMGSDEPFCLGRDELYERYAALFERSPDLNFILTNRLVCGNFVIDEELVSGLEPGREVRAIAIYEIKDSLIQNVWFIKDDGTAKSKGK